MNIENYIEMQYRELISIANIDNEFSDLYSKIQHQRLREILCTLHSNFISLFRTMNERLPTGNLEGHYLADDSRQLIKNIEICLGLYHALKNSKYAFEIEDYYFDLITQCRGFLQSSWGSDIPANMDKITLYYTVPIFTSASTIIVNNTTTDYTFPLQLIGSGSYANVYKYRDTFYNKDFVLKRAKKELTEKELLRFKREFDEMQELSSPYIVEVYSYNKLENEYTMEFMDCTLDEYISRNNQTLSGQERKNIVKQIIKAFEYIHSKDMLHRDINPKNILLKIFDDVIVVKIADFGLVKVPDSSYTSATTEFKGYYNDPFLLVEGFQNYNVVHETYALTRVISYVLSGKSNPNKITDPKLRAFVEKGLNTDKTIRFQTVYEMAQIIREI